MSRSNTKQAECFISRQLTDQQRLFYEQQGYLVVGRTLTDCGLEQMRQECMDAWLAEKRGFDKDKSWLQNALLPNIHHHSSVVRQFYFHGPLLDVAEHIIGPNIKGATSQLTFKMRGNTMPFDWHQDNGYGELDPYNAMTCLTALDDADQENGCLWLIPKSHREGQGDTNRGEQEKGKQVAISMDVDESSAVPMPLKAGESLVFHCHMLHKSEDNRSKVRDRRILFLRYADADAVEVYNDCKPRLGRLLRGKTKYVEVAEFEADFI